VNEPERETNRLDAARVSAARWWAAATRWHGWEIAVWTTAALVLVAWPTQAPLFNEIAILALFALSLDLILGYAGIVSLGHAAFFGLGAYSAALFAKHVHGDPLLGMVIAAVAAGVLGLVSSLLILRGSDLTRLMVTLGVALIFYELANKLDWLTGGADGLQGVVMQPLLGVFPFDLAGRVASAYSFVLLLVLFIVARRLVRSPFGIALQAIRDNRLRAGAIGIDTNRQLIVIYTIAAVYAGIAGGLLAQTTGFASLDVFDFHRSADVLLVLVIGGIGYLYGGVFGAIGFKLMQDLLSALTPQYWTFWLGLVLVVIVLVGRNRFGAGATRLRRMLGGVPKA
jgi:branched-chain amino acid transport system permease protein